MRFLKLASNWLDRAEGDPFVWPYWIDLSVEGPRVAFAEGVAHGASGGVFTVAQALEPKWDKHFDAAEGVWLRPYLRRLASGEELTEAELAWDFEERHGRPPEHYDWD